MIDVDHTSKCRSMLLNIDPMMLLSYASLDEDPMCGSTLINLQLTMKCSYTVIISVDHGLLFYLPCQISADEFLAFPNPYNSGLVFHDNELRMDVPDQLSTGILYLLGNPFFI